MLTKIKCFLHKLKKPLTGYIIMTLAFGAAFAFIYQGNREVCAESHRRYQASRDLVTAVFTINDVTRKRVHGAQLAELASYYHDERVFLLGKLGGPPAC